MIKLSYFDKINPYGIYIKNIGNIHSPFLKDIARIGYYQYQYYITLLLYTPEKYCEYISKDLHVDNPWNKLTNDEKNSISMFDILTKSDDLRIELINALSLFICGTLEWDEKHSSIVIDKIKEDDGKETVGGFINKKTYSTISNVCLQFVDVSIDDMPEEQPKFATEKDRLFYEHFQKKKAEHEKTKKSDPRFELPNMISLLCTFHNSVNYTNVFEMTIGQLKDTFYQLMKMRQLNITDTNYAVWGGKKYDPSSWMSCVDSK